MTDLKAFTRDLAAQMESDLGTRLDWVAIGHWNTDNPHVHLLVRGVAENGSDLVISRDYISHGLRSRGRGTWSRSNSVPSRNTRFVLPLSGRWTRSVGHASTRRSGWRQMTAASSTWAG
jgi:type IV secretory pathway VirD2 relaxase